mmetsp:Transcript_15132/g.27337  ORF Transcript_15132/g.27337 Transcript_15132/m.27337 type:complete len:236 (+) Transcript_15132:1636-2343(+)
MIVRIMVLSNLPRQGRVRQLSILGICCHACQSNDIPDGKCSTHLDRCDDWYRLVSDTNLNSRSVGTTIAIIDCQRYQVQTSSIVRKVGVALVRVDDTISIKVPLECQAITIGIITTGPTKHDCRTHGSFRWLCENNCVWRSVSVSNVRDASNLVNSSVVKSLSITIGPKVHIDNLKPLCKFSNLHTRLRRITGDAPRQTNIFENINLTKDKISVHVGSIVLFRPNSIGHKGAARD